MSATEAATGTAPHVLPGADVDPGDPRRPWRAGPLLATFAAAGVLTSADVRVAERLGLLTGEVDPTVHLAAALAVRAVRSGSVCVDLADAPTLAAEGSPEDPDAPAPDVDLPWPDLDPWTAAVRRSPLVADGVDGPADRPVRWVDGRVYLDRYWRDEQVVRREVDARLVGLLDVDDAALRAAVHARFGRPQDSRQRLATATAAVSRLTVLTGGPGTGKTTTVARLVAVLRDVAGPGLRVALAAPTGKAAARLQEAVNFELARLAGETADATAAAPLTASTVHRLLGWRPSGTRFAHDRTHRLPHDVVVLDEASMVSLPLLARVLDALRPDARLVLVGDPDQLASVEAGAVLGDLVHRRPLTGPPSSPVLVAAATTALVDVPPPGPGEVDDRAVLGNGVVRLRTVHRQDRDSEILPLAAAIQTGDADETLTLLRRGHESVQFLEAPDDEPDDAALAAVRADAVTAGTLLVEAARAGDAQGALEALARHRVMVAHRRGPAGRGRWAAQVESWVEEATLHHATDSPWVAGRPLLVTTNDAEVGLYNGDTGVLVADRDGGGTGVIAVFGDPRAPLRVRTHRLPPVETVHAMTVHRAQGSQFDRVTLVLPPATSPLLTRELLYTAVTRAQTFVRVVGSEAAVRTAVTSPVHRASGLRAALPHA